MKLSKIFATLVIATALTACGEETSDAAKGAAAEAGTAAVKAGKETVEAGGDATEAAKNAASAAVGTATGATTEEAPTEAPK